MNNLATQVGEIVTGASAQFISTLTQYKWDLIPDSQLQAAKQALTKNDYIMRVACGNVDAVHDALVKSAILGLDLTEGKRQGWLLPRKNSAGQMVVQLQVGYKGVEAIHQRMGVIDRLSIRVIREADQFEWSGDDREKPSHKADWFGSDKDRGKIIGAFAVTYFPDESINVVVTSITEIHEKHRDISDSWKSYKKKLAEGKYAFPPPWVDYEKAMVEKTMAYIASKQWPANIRDKGVSSKIVSTLHEVDVADYTWPEKEIALEPTLPEYSKEAFDENSITWMELIKEGKRTPQDIINMVKTRFILSPGQEETILGYNKVVNQHGDKQNNDAWLDEYEATSAKLEQGEML